jgi:death on curing protein
VAGSAGLAFRYRMRYHLREVDIPLGAVSPTAATCVTHDKKSSAVSCGRAMISGIPALHPLSCVKRLQTRATVVGAEAYPDIHTKAAALLHSLCRNHALVDGNKRLAWTACQVFLGLNGEWVEASEDDRFDLMIAVASGAIDNVDQIAEQLRTWCS